MKNKKSSFNILSFIIFFGIGFVCAPVMDSISADITNIVGEYGYFFLLLIFMAITFTSLLLQTILHEVGHLIFGLVTKYKLISFRIFSIIWIKEDGKIKVKRVKVPGTAGQCLMVPPEMKYDEIPHVLYNLGGVIINLITSAVGLIVFCLTDHINILHDFIYIFSVVGIGVALLNGLPMLNGGIPNDGNNTLVMSKVTEARKAFYITLKQAEFKTKGIRSKYIPSEYFSMPSEENIKYPLISALSVQLVDRIMDRGEYKNASEIIEWILGSDIVLPNIYYSTLKTDLLFCELVGQNRVEQVNMIYDKKLSIFIQRNGVSPMVLHTKYAFTVLCERDFVKAEKLKRTFLKLSRHYPYKCDIESVLEKLALVDMIAGIA